MRAGRTQEKAFDDEAARLTEALAQSERLVAEQAAALAHYRKMYERSSVLARIGVWECELATEALRWTDAVYDLFELPRGDPITRSRVLELYEESSRLEMERRRADAIRTCSGFALDIQIRTALGNPRWLHLTIDVEQENGRAVRIFGTKQDITETKVAEAKVKALQSELIQVSRRSAMGTMAATVAHELNQPLAAISNYAAGARRALRGRKPDLAVAENGLEAIEGNAVRAGMVIRSLREIVDGSKVRRQPVAGDRLMREAAALALAERGGRVAVNYRFGPGLLLFVDPVQFQQVMINLIKNAAEAARGQEGCEIVISASRDAAGQLEIHVDDNGPGIAPDMQTRLFRAFVSSKPDGMGVGLAISRTIVEAHGGRIHAVNRDEGGASLRIVLPVPGDPDPHPPVLAAAGGSGRPARDDSR